MLDDKQKILILGGTKEAAELAETLTAEGHDVTTSLAGRTKEAKPITGKTRIGGFGGSNGLADWINANGITKLIDATHPFALQISENAKTAAKTTGVIFEVLLRKPWKREPNDIWVEVPSIERAVAEIPYGATVLLALGSQHIEPFTQRHDVNFIIRMVDAPHCPLPFENYRLLLERPSQSVAAEMSTLIEHQCTHIVCRNSGGKGAYAKIEAARKRRLPVIMISRPAS